MTIVFFTAIFAILLFANQDNFLSQKLGENSFISNMLAKLSKENNSKDKPEFVLPFGLWYHVSAFSAVPPTGARKRT